MSFTDFDCGIAVPHIHTGELYEKYDIEYFCPTTRRWVENSECVETGRLHKRCRTVSTSTEIIELVTDEVEPVQDWLKYRMAVKYNEFVARKMKKLFHEALYGEGGNICGSQ